MAIIQGREPYVGLGIEATAGTAVNASIYVPYNSCNFKAVYEHLNDEAGRGVREKSWGTAIGKYRGEGDIETNVDAENSVYFFYPALGVISSTKASGETVVYTHTITRKASNPPKTVTIVDYDGQGTRKYTYGTINKLDFKVADGLATISASLLAKAPVSGTGTRTVTTNRVLSFKDVSVKLGSSNTSSSVALTNAIAATASPVRAFNLSINNNAEALYCSGTGSPYVIALGEFEITGDWTAFYEGTVDRSYYETLKRSSKTYTAMYVSMTGNSIGTAETQEIDIKLYNINLTDWGLDKSLNGFVTENPKFTAVYDSTNAKSIQVEITNQTASYA